MHNYIPDSNSKMISLHLQGLWIISNYPVFRSAIQLPLSGQHSSPRRGNLLQPAATPWAKRHQILLRPVRATNDDVIITFSGF